MYQLIIGECSKCVEIIEKDDKRQITAVLGGTMSRDFLPSATGVQRDNKALSSLIQVSK